jgi:hypothetical protein
MAKILKPSKRKEAARVNLTYPVLPLGNHREWMGHLVHAT